jgi:subtilisin family serine protease
MSRNKTILFVAPALVIVLGLAAVIQFKKLPKQLRSAVRIIPGDSKSREDAAESEINQNVAVAAQRPTILVKFRAGLSADAINQITTRFHDQILDEVEAVPGLRTVRHPDDETEAAKLAAQYQTLPEVEYAEPNYEIAIDQAANEAPAANDPRYNEQWALTSSSVPQAWSKTKGSSDVVVAVLDSGIEYTHVDLSNNIWTRPSNLAPYRDQDLGTIDDIHGYNAVDNDGDPLDQNGHGTDCAGVIGAECGNNTGVCGVNWKVQIMPLKFINAGGFGYLADAIEAINYAIDRKQAGVNLRVINASWGLTQHSRALEDIIRKASEAGILFVAAGGNTGTNNDTSPHYPASYNIGNVISVAATDPSDALVQSSNFGAKSVHIAAPGQDILTTALGNEYEKRSGTSLAAPIVSGVAALVLSAHPHLSVDQLRRLLLESVDKRPGLQGKVTTGGRINAARAVTR